MTEGFWRRRAFTLSPEVDLFCHCVCDNRLTFKFDRNYHVRQNRRACRKFKAAWRSVNRDTSCVLEVGKQVGEIYIGISVPQGQRRAARKSSGSIGRVSFTGWSFALVIGYKLTRFVRLSVDFAGILISPTKIRRRCYSKEQAGEKLITIMLRGYIKKKQNNRRDWSAVIRTVLNHPVRYIETRDCDADYRAVA